jgi:hypothetical protein
MAATRIIPMHINKGKTVSACLKERVEYAKNGEKTEQGRFVSSYECNPETADQEFLLSRSVYKRKTARQYKGDVIAYQLRQSFKPGEITPEEANQIGYETAMRFTKGKHAFIVCTHTDRPHIHNHIIFNSVNLDADRKFKNSWLSYIGLRTLSDIICLEHGMSVIVPRKFAEQDRGSRYHNVSFRQMLREKIDDIMNNRPDSFEKFLDKLHEQGYEIKRGKHTAVKGKDQKRFIRLDSLGEGYTEEGLCRELDGEPHESEEKESSKTPKKKRNFEYLIDIQEKIRQGKGKGYEYWAKNFNTKQVAETVIFLQRNEVTSYELLQERAESSAKEFHRISEKIKGCEERLDEITEMKKAIINFAKTKNVFDAYHKSGYSKKFFEEHRAEIMLYKSAKDVFKKHEGKKLPKVKELSDEFGRILSGKRKLYEEYKNAKKEMMDYQIAKSNVDKVKRYQPDKDEPERSKTENKTR